MTAPRADLGDSIKTAFRNIDELLRENSMEVTPDNRRAVRILGYNSMEITEENINAVKEADAMLNRVLSRMTPEKTLPSQDRKANRKRRQFLRLHSLFYGF